MRIPDIEMRALHDWSLTELERIEKEYPPIPGTLDGRYVVEENKHFAEYNRRLAVLKQKYDPIPEPAAKARTFDQVRKRAGVV